MRGIPIWHRFGMMDYLCASASAVASLLGLYHRDVTSGTGQAVAASLLGSSLLTVSETAALPDGSLLPFARLDRDQTGISPGCRMYRVRDGWVAVVAPTPETLAALLRVATTEDERLLASRLASHNRDELLAALDAAGVPSEPVLLDQREAFLSDPANIAAGLVAVCDHPRWGRLEEVGSFWEMGEASQPLDRAAPELAQHTTEVLAEAGYSHEQLEQLAASGAILARAFAPSPV